MQKKYIALAIASFMFASCLSSHKSTLAEIDPDTGLLTLRHSSTPIWHAKLHSNYLSGRPRVIMEIRKGLIKNAWSFGPDDECEPIARVVDYEGEILKPREDGSLHSSIVVDAGRPKSITYFDGEGEFQQSKEFGSRTQ
jgi:hypothetical protein